MNAIVILPTYNEKDNIERVVSGVQKSVAADILIIDDNSPDGTGEIAENIAKRNSSVSVMRRPAQLGLGNAYIAGFKRALQKNYDTIIQMDSDLSHSPEDLPRLLEALGQNDLVIGSRYIDGGSIEGWAFYRKYISSFGNIYARVILNSPIRDLTSGFKAWKRKVIESLDLDAIISDGYSFQIETTCLALKLGFKAAEVPIVFKDRAMGKSKLSKKIILEAIFTVWKLRLR